MSWADNAVNILRTLPISNPKPDLLNVNAYSKFGEIPCYLLKLSSGNENMGVSQADNSVKICRNLPISNPKPDLLNVNAYSKFGENPLLFTKVIVRKRKYGRVSGRLTPSKIDEICPSAIPNQIYTISMHIPSLVKIHSCLLKLSPQNEMMDGLMDDQRETIILLCGGV